MNKWGFSFSFLHVPFLFLTLWTNGVLRSAFFMCPLKAISKDLRAGIICFPLPIIFLLTSLAICGFVWILKQTENGIFHSAFFMCPLKAISKDLRTAIIRFPLPIIFLLNSLAICGFVWILKQTCFPVILVVCLCKLKLRRLYWILP